MAKITLQGLSTDKAALEAAHVELPKFDVKAVQEYTKTHPVWIHCGAGNIFRGFIAALQQNLLNEGLADRGIIAADTFDYDINDEVIIGNSEAKLEGVIGTSLYWKGLSVSVNFRYRLGADNYNRELFNRIENLSLDNMITYNQDKRALYDRWQKPGDIAQYKRITDVAYSDNQAHMTSRYLQKENTLSGESISLSYQFGDQAWLKKVRLQNMTIRANMNDMFYLSTVKAERGTSYPFARSMSFTINMTF